MSLLKFELRGANFGSTSAPPPNYANADNYNGLFVYYTKQFID